ncbi:hypothetical protein ABK040_013913 [Willaertia magna]
MSDFPTEEQLQPCIIANNNNIDNANSNNKQPSLSTSSLSQHSQNNNSLDKELDTQYDESNISPPTTNEMMEEHQSHPTYYPNLRYISPGLRDTNNLSNSINIYTANNINKNNNTSTVNNITPYHTVNNNNNQTVEKGIPKKGNQLMNTFRSTASMDIEEINNYMPTDYPYKNSNLDEIEPIATPIKISPNLSSSTNSSNYEQKSTFLYQVSEKGFVLPIIVTIITNFQKVVEKELIEAVKSIPKELEEGNNNNSNNNADFSFVSLFQFRYSETYLKHLELVKNTCSVNNCNAYCQLIFEWLYPSKEQNKDFIPEWSYSKFNGRLMEILNLANVKRDNAKIHCLNIGLWIAVGDLLSTVLRFYHPTQFDSSLFSSILHYCFDVVIFDTFSNSKNFMVWKRMKNYLIDQWCFVIRRLSSKNLSEVVPFVIGKIQKTSKEVSRWYLTGLKYIDVELVNNKMDSLRNLIDSLLDIGEKDKNFKNSTKGRNTILHILQTIYLQLDFELEENCNLLEDFTSRVSNLITAFEKTKLGQKGNSKSECFILRSLLVKHLTFQYHHHHTVKLTEDLLEFLQKKKDNVEYSNQCLCALGIILKDKYHINKNLNPYSLIGGPYNNFLSKFKPFVEVAYKEEDRNSSYFTDNEDIQTKTKYYETMMIASNLILVYLGKLNSIPLSMGTIDQTILYYALIIVRIATIDLNGVIGKDGIIYKFLAKDPLKHPEFLIIAFKVLKIISSGDDLYDVDVQCCKSEVEAIQRFPDFKHLMTVMSRDVTLKKTLRLLLQQLNFEVLHFVDFDLPIKKFDSIMIFSQEEETEFQLTSSDTSDTLNINTSITGQTEMNTVSTPTSDTSETSLDLSSQAIIEAEHNLNNPLTISKQSSLRKLTREYSLIEEHQTLSEFSSKKSTNDVLKTLTTYRSFVTSVDESTKRKHKRTKSAKELKLKKDRFELVTLLTECLSTIPLFASDDLFSFDKPYNFIGSYLICGDNTIALCCSKALQITMQNNKYLRSTIMHACTELLLTQLYQFREVFSIKVLFKNILQLLNIWISDSGKGIDSTIVSNWVFELEAICIMALCLNDRQIRMNALLCLKTLSQLFLPYFSNFCYTAILNNQSKIIHKAVRKIEMRESMGMDDLFAKDILLQLSNETFENIIQSDSSYTVLYTYMIGFIGEVLVETNCKAKAELLKLVKDYCIYLSNNFYLIDESTSLWTDSLSLLVSICGVFEYSEQSKIILDNHKESVKNCLKQIEIFDRFLICGKPWIQRAIVNVCSSVNYQSISLILELLHSYLDEKTHKFNISTIITIKDVSRILVAISQHYGFKKLVEHKTLIFNTTNLMVSLITKMYNILNSEKEIRFKDPFHIYCYFHSYMCNAIALNNIARHLCMTTNFFRRKPLTMTNSLYLRHNNIWSEESRLYCINILKECIESRVQHLQQMGSNFLERIKDEKTKEYWKQEYNNILQSKLKHVCYNGIVSILKLDPLPSLIENHDYHTFFMNAELLGYRMLDSILCHHFDRLCEEFIAAIYNSTDDNLCQIYVNALYDVLLPSFASYAPIQGIKEDKIDWIIRIREQDMHRENVEVLEEDSFIEAVIQTHTFSLLHVLLYLLYHPFDSIHSKACTLLLNLIRINFAHHDKGTIDPNKRERILCSLEELEATFRTSSMGSLGEYATHFSGNIAKLYPRFTNDLFSETFRYLPRIAIEERRSWVISFLNPWSDQLDLVPFNSDDEVVIENLFGISLNLLQCTVGFSKDLQNIWKQISLQGGSKVNPLSNHTVDLQIIGLNYSSETTTPRNLIMIMNYLKKKIILSESFLKDKAVEYVCRSIISSLYAVQPRHTLQLLVHDLPNAPVSYGNSIMAMLNDVVCNVENKSIFFEQLHIILVYTISKLDGTNEYAHNLFTTILLRIISYTGGKQLEQRKWQLLLELFRFNFVKVRWRSNMIEVDGVLTEEVESLLPFTSRLCEISSRYLIHTLVECIESSVSHHLVDYFAHHALEIATNQSSCNQFTNMFIYLTIFYYILEKSNSLTLTQFVLHRIIYCLYIATEGFLYTEESRFYGVESSDLLENYYIELKLLCLNILRLVLHKAPNLDYSILFWTLTSLLQSGFHDNEEYTESIIATFNDMKLNQQLCKKYFVVENENLIKSEMQKYFGNTLIHWKGILFSFSDMLPLVTSKPATQQKMIEIILTFMKSPSDSVLFDEVGERRFLSSILILLPYFVYDIEDDETHIMINQISQLLAKNSNLISLANAFSCTNIEPNDFVDRICKELVTIYFDNKNITFCAELLTRLYLKSNEHIRDIILLIASCFIKHAPNEANAFALLLKLAVSSNSFFSIPFLSTVFISNQSHQFQYTPEDVPRLNEICQYIPELDAEIRGPYLIQRLRNMVELGTFQNEKLKELQLKTSEELTEEYLSKKKIGYFSDFIEEYVEPLNSDFNLNTSLSSPPRTPQSIIRNGNNNSFFNNNSNNFSNNSRNNSNSTTTPTSSGSGSSSHISHNNNNNNNNDLEFQFPGLSDLLYKKEYTYYFKKFASQHQGENMIDFLIEVQQFKQEIDSVTLAVHAKRIIETFFSDSAIYKLLCLTEEERNNIINIYRENMFSPSNSLFIEAAEIVQGELIHTLYPTFQKSSEWIELCETIKKNNLH